MNTELLRETCLRLPHTTEDMKWGEHLCFLIGEKIYCLTSLDEEFSVSVKVNEEDFHELVMREGITQAPHFARNQWVNIKDPGALSPEEWNELLSGAYKIIKAKLSRKLQEKLK
jgi:predicted DNA-binding protein (MmcQ/YjbR family)